MVQPPTLWHAPRLEVPLVSPLPGEPARVIRRKRHPLHVEDELLPLRAGFLYAVHAFRQEISNSFASRYAFDDAEKSLGVSETGVDPQGVIPVDHALLEELHGEGNRVARGHRVQPELVTELVRFHHGAEVRYPAIGAKQPHGLELGSRPGALVRPSRTTHIFPHATVQR